MKELHALVDYENVQPTLEELAKLAPGFTDVWLFHGPHQAKQAQQLEATHRQVTLVPRSGKGRNALDFHLTFYLGYVAAKHPDAHLVVVANDKGYDPMIAHARLLKFTVKRLSHKPKKTPPVKKAPTAKAAAPQAQPPAAKNAAPAKKPAAAKKAAPAVKPMPANNATLVKQPTPVKKAAVNKKKAASPKAQVQPKVAASSESKEIARVKKALVKMGDKRPEKLNSFLRSLESMLGKGATQAAVQSVVKKLELANILQISGEKVRYT